MAVYLPLPEELVSLEAPTSQTRDVLQRLQGVLHVPISWNAMLVTTRQERKVLLEGAEFAAADQYFVELAIDGDPRKITVRRCVWAQEIALAELTANLLTRKREEAASGETKQVSSTAPPNRKTHHDPYAPVEDTSLLSHVVVGKRIHRDDDSDGGSVHTPSSLDCHRSSDEDDHLRGYSMQQSSKQAPSSRKHKRTSDYVSQRHEDDDDVSDKKHHYTQIPSKCDIDDAYVEHSNKHNNARGRDAYDEEHHNNPVVTRNTSSMQQPSSFPALQDRFATFVGIDNQANTCYLNAALQCLYHVPYFRNCMYDVDVEQLKRRDVITALQSLFAGLQLKYPAVTTIPLTTAFRWTEEDLRHQHDVHEMILILLDCIEKQIFNSASRTTSPQNDIQPPPPTTTTRDEDGDSNPDVQEEVAAATEETRRRHPKKNFVQQLFHGEQTYATRVPTASYESKQSEPFLVLELSVQNLTSLEASLEELCRPSSIEGFNVEHPDGTKSSHTAERSLQFSQLPPVLMVHPNRVVFDFERMAQVTVNTRWTFPVHLDLAPFAQPSCQHPQQRNRCMSTTSDDEDNTGPLHSASQGNEEEEDTQPTASPKPLQPSEPQGSTAVDEQMLREGSLFPNEAAAQAANTEGGSAVHIMTDYELRVVVLHSGTAATGHYIACTRIEEGRWICFNDEKAHTISEAEVFRRAYGGSADRFSGSREERAKLLLYVRKSTATRLLTEPAVPKHIVPLARLHERRVEREYHLMGEAFSDALGSRKSEVFHRTVLRFDYAASATFDEVIARLAKRHRVSPDRVIIWRYGYQFIEHPSDRAHRVTSVNELLPSNLVVEIIPEEELFPISDERTTKEDESRATPPPPAGIDTSAITMMFPLRVWVHQGLQYVGTVRSGAQAFERAKALLNSADADEQASLQNQNTSCASIRTSTPTVSERPSSEPPGSLNTTLDDASGLDMDTPVSNQPLELQTPAWNLYSYYGMHAQLRLVSPSTTMINGVNLIAAPSTVRLEDIVSVLNARPVAITIFMINAIDCDDATEVWDITVDENLTYTELQQVIYDKIGSTAAIIADSLHDLERHLLSPAYLTSPRRIGLFSHNMETCGPNHLLQQPARSKYSVTRVRDLLRGHSSESIVRRIYFDILPPEMDDPACWAEMLHFVVATGLERKVIAYANLSNQTVGDYLRALHAQAMHRLVELQWIPITNLRILGLDWKGKIFKDYRDHHAHVSGQGVTSYSIDVVGGVEWVLSTQPTKTYDDEEGDGELQPELEYKRDDMTQSDGDGDDRGGEFDTPAVSQSEGTTATAAPAITRRLLDVYHMVQYSHSDETLIALPASILVDVNTLPNMTGEALLDAILEASQLPHDSSRYHNIKELARLVLRGEFLVDSATLNRNETIGSKYNDIGGTLRSVLVDQTDCLMASVSAGSRTPSVGRTPVKTIKQRAPEAVIRIAD